MDGDSLQLLPEEKWLKLESSLKLDWPRSIVVINLLDMLKRLPDLRQSFEYKIYCPFGDVNIGMVATCAKKFSYEVVIHCSRELDTFSEAIKRSKVINWDFATVQFTDRCVMESVMSTIRSLHVEWWHLESYDVIYLERDFFDIRIPEDKTLDHLSVEHAKQVDSNWEHRHPGSEWYFQELIKSNLGYGLFEKDSKNLVGWILYTEFGTFDYMYVLDSYRRKGYGELLSKVSYNYARKHKENMYALCVKGNSSAFTIFEKIGFKVIGEVFCTIVKGKTQSKI